MGWCAGARLLDGSQDHSGWVFYLHGHVNDPGSFTLYQSEYNKHAPAFAKSMVPVARAKHLLFIGALGTLWDAHFLALWHSLMTGKLHCSRADSALYDADRLLALQMSSL